MYTNPRLVDWGLALTTAVAFATGLFTLVSGRSESRWVFDLHAIAGYALCLLMLPKLVRVRRRLLPSSRNVSAWVGRTAALLASGVLLSGIAWALGAPGIWLGYNLLNWHIIGGFLLTALVSWHMFLRARPLRRTDLTDRRSLLRFGGLSLLALIALPLKERLTAAFGWPGAARRFTGSRELASFTGNAFPVVSWVADRPQPITPADWRLQIRGLVARPLALTHAELDRPLTQTATLDCTGGFYSTQHWQGTPVRDLLAMAAPDPTARWVRFVSATGYHWSLPIAQLDDCLIATRVGGDALSHGHGAPARLVAPGERGFIWVKWLVAIELHATPDLRQLAAINTSWRSPVGSGAVAYADPSPPGE